MEVGWGEGLAMDCFASLAMPILADIELFSSLLKKASAEPLMHRWQTL
jgi:hypothetical protein